MIAITEISSFVSSYSRVYGFPITGQLPENILQKQGTKSLPPLSVSIKPLTLSGVY